VFGCVHDDVARAMRTRMHRQRREDGDDLEFVLNGGTFVGEAWALGAMFARLDALGPASAETDDQRQLNEAANAFGPWFAEHAAIDEHRVVFANLLCGLLPAPFDAAVDMETGALIGGMTPCFVHGAGHCNLDAIARHAGLSVVDFEARTHVDYVAKAAAMYAPYVEQEAHAALACVAVTIALVAAVVASHR